MQLHAPLHGVRGTVSWFVGGLYLPKNREMSRFTSVKESFHLDCKFLCRGATSAVWLNHFKNKTPALDSVPKCAGMIFCPPALKNIPYVSRNSNTPSEGAVVKKTAQVNSGMCISKEKTFVPKRKTFVFQALCASVDVALLGVRSSSYCFTAALQSWPVMKLKCRSE